MVCTANVAVRMSSSTPSAVAAFDVDGTITRRDCVVPFLTRMRGRVPLALRLLARPVNLGRAAVARDRDALKELATQAALSGLAWDEIEGQANDFADTVVRTGLRDDTLARLRWHREQGHTVVFVSASLEVYLREIARRIGVDAVLGTRLVVDASGTCTGRLDGPNCRGPEKEVRLRRWMAENGLADVPVWAYGDSSGDDQLLAMAAHPLRVDGVTVPAEPVGSAS
jgi:phosphatidylglycerophosphatase C